MRLAGSTLAYEGRLEIYHDGVWGTVCDDGFDDTNAAVACYSLGFGSVSELLQPSHANSACKINKNSSADDITNVNFFTTLSHTYFEILKKRTYLV